MGCKFINLLSETKEKVKVAFHPLDGKNDEKRSQRACVIHLGIINCNEVFSSPSVSLCIGPAALVVPGDLGFVKKQFTTFLVSCPFLPLCTYGKMVNIHNLRPITSTVQYTLKVIQGTFFSLFMNKNEKYEVIEISTKI